MPVALLKKLICNVVKFFYVQFNPTALRKAKIINNFSLSECSKVKFGKLETSVRGLSGNFKVENERQPCLYQH